MSVWQRGVSDGAECFLAALLLIWAVMMGTTAQAEVTSVFDRAVAEDLPGKYAKGACLPFAKELYARFSRSGIEAHLIAYAWNDRMGESGLHAFVVYRDEEGRYWGMDNLRHQPLWLGGNTVLDWSQSFSPYTTVTVRAHLSNRTPSRIAFAAAARTTRMIAPVTPSRAPVSTATSSSPPRIPDETLITSLSGVVPSRALTFSDVP